MIFRVGDCAFLPAEDYFRRVARRIKRVVFFRQRDFRAGFAIYSVGETSALDCDFRIFRDLQNPVVGTCRLVARDANRRALRERANFLCLRRFHNVFSGYRNHFCKSSALERDLREVCVCQAQVKRLFAEFKFRRAFVDYQEIFVVFVTLPDDKRTRRSYLRQSYRVARAALVKFKAAPVACGQNNFMPRLFLREDKARRLKSVKRERPD